MASIYSKNAPIIPDHQILRKIGEGSYGEVWLGRGVTGAFRAIKVVRRTDFDDEPSFELEFNGILRFEQISRENRGLVNILHVGRNREEGFYYYVMELGDDVEKGREINPVDYEPRSLRTDTVRKGRLPMDECVDIGIVLAEALQFLHEKDLVHRDIKPANIIFVNGQAKLADIGLVAPAGRQTFVGTMGFVPPEGPGSEAADIYSLGMVLYEISSGNDRMDFPEVPDDLPDANAQKLWRSLNSVLCAACAPNADERYETAADLGEALNDVKSGREVKSVRPKSHRVTLVASLVALAVMIGGWVWNRQENQTVTSVVPQNVGSVSNPGTILTPQENTEDPVPTSNLCAVKFFSEPENALVHYNGRLITTTPQTVYGLEAGEKTFVFKKENYRDEVVVRDIRPDQRNLISVKMRPWMPPMVGKPWRNELDMDFSPEGDEHFSQLPIRISDFDEFVKATGVNEEVFSTNAKVNMADGDTRTEKIALMTLDQVRVFVEWLTGRELASGFLTRDHYYSFSMAPGIPPKRADDGQVYQAFNLIVRQRVYGSVTINTSPAGATVSDSQGRKFTGVTPLTIERLLPGKMIFDIRLDGHASETVALTVEPEQRKVINLNLQVNRGVVFDRPWTNSLDMTFIPIRGVMWSIYETRLGDWRRYERDAGIPAVASPSFVQGDDHPFSRASRDDAEAFCRWLTRKERAEGLIGEDHEYRLPTDREWSLAAGLDDPPESSPAELDGLAIDQYPWGREFPPPGKVGNYAGAEAPRFLQERGVIEGFEDGFPYTAPVGSFPRNADGLFDLGGNVWEWVSDNYGGRLPRHAVCRGASWADARPENLMTSMRNAFSPDYRGDGLYGFRTVISRVATVELDDQDPQQNTPVTTGEEESASDYSFDLREFYSTPSEGEESDY